MKLYFAPTSPYARKVRVVAHELGIPLHLVAINTLDPKSTFGDINPIHRVPALELDDGRVLFDSPVICEYLDTEFEGQLLPSKGDARWAVLVLQALGDGLMDAAVPRRHESLRPLAQQSPDRLWLYRRSIEQISATLERRIHELVGVNLGTIAIACALGYLDFRFPEDEWRIQFPALADWHEAFEARASMRNTRFEST